MGKREQIDDAVAYVIKRLKAHGFTLQRYDAYSTNSVYLKLDFGIANSIRFSDHRGKKHLSYMFNVSIAHQGAVYSEKKKYARYFYGATQKQLDELVVHLVRHRERRIMQYTREGYLTQMEKARIEGRHKPGFWQEAKLIHKGAVPSCKDTAMDLNEGVIRW